MRNIKLAFLIFFFTTNIYSQSFRYENWVLNEVVTFEDVVNYLGDRTKILEPKYGSSIGQDIKYQDNFNTTTTLCFDKNTQILHCVFIDGIIDDFFVNQLRQSIFDQLGKPIYGYEIKEYSYSKEKPEIINCISYKREYRYKKDKYLIILDFTKVTKYKSNSGPYIYLPRYGFSACIHERPNSDSGIPTSYPSLDNQEYHWGFNKYELINKW